MYILYIDDSGSVENAGEKNFVLGGNSVFERGLYHQIKLADDCVASFNLGEDCHDIELHGTDMYSGRSGTIWRSIRERAKREAMIKQALSTVVNQASLRLFAVVVDKASVSPEDSIALAFEEICNRFNLFIARMNDRHNQKQRGLIVMDETKHEKPLQMLARGFRINGARWGHFRNLAEVPLFVDSRASRLVQLADLVAWATFRRYEHSDGRFFDPIIDQFDADGGVFHGLVHRRAASVNCYCPACHSRYKKERGIS